MKFKKKKQKKQIEEPYSSLVGYISRHHFLAIIAKTLRSQTKSESAFFFEG